MDLSTAIYAAQVASMVQEVGGLTAVIAGSVAAVRLTFNTLAARMDEDPLFGPSHRYLLAAAAGLALSLTAGLVPKERVAIASAVEQHGLPAVERLLDALERRQ